MQEKAKEVACHIDGHSGTNTLKLEMIGGLEEEIQRNVQTRNPIVRKGDRLGSQAVKGQHICR